MIAASRSAILSYLLPELAQAVFETGGRDEHGGPADGPQPLSSESLSRLVASAALRPDQRTDLAACHNTYVNVISDTGIFSEATIRVSQLSLGRFRIEVRVTWLVYVVAPFSMDKISRHRPV